MKKNNDIKEVVVITGASSGFGYNAAIMLAEKGYKIYALARRIEKMEELKNYDITPMKLDVTSDDDVKKVIDEIGTKEGHIDTLINCAGYGAFGPVEEVNIDEAKYQLDVNVLSISRLTSATLKYMRPNNKGRIINIASVAGICPLYFGAWYNASKFAVEGLSAAMRMELKKFNIKVIIIEPAAFASNWGVIAKDKLLKYSINTPYEEDGKLVSNIYANTFAKKGFIAKDPIISSKKIVKAATKKHPRYHYRFGRFSNMLPLMYHFLPKSLYDKLILGTFNSRFAKKIANKN